MKNSGDDEGTFPSGSEFVWFLLIHSEDQISFLKGSPPQISSVESTQVLLIDGRADQGHLPLLLKEVDCILPGLLRFSYRVEFDSGRIVKQVTRQNCFSSIDQKEWSSPVDRLGVVLNPQRTDGSSSTHAPAACLRSRISRGFSPLRTRPFARSACPIDWG